MQLADVIVPHDDFESMLHHMSTHGRGHNNMHLRQRRTKKYAYAFHYMHALRAEGRTIYGAISGPSIYWEYVLTEHQLTVNQDKASNEERDRIFNRFLPEIRARMKSERNQPPDIRPTRKSGEFYLMRSASGSPSTSPVCEEAVGLKVVDKRFVAWLKPWRFSMFRKA